MKIRNGFVSNSSSSSFAIFGVELDESELEALTNSSNEEDEYFDPRDAFDKVGLDYYGYDGYGAAVGVDINSLWNQVPPELREQILAPIKEKIEKVLGREVKVEFIQGEYPC